jgi:hypothetical protein
MVLLGQAMKNRRKKIGEGSRGANYLSAFPRMEKPDKNRVGAQYAVPILRVLWAPGHNHRQIESIRVSHRTNPAPTLQARPLLIGKSEEGHVMEQLREPNEEAILQLQQMLNTPIEDQAASYELNLLSSVLENGAQLLENSESNQETCEILRQIIKSAFVIGRRHINLLV